MMFNSADPDINFDRSRWVSKGGKWEIGHVSMMFGVRVRLGKTGEGYVVLDLCAGADHLLQDDLMRCVMVILMPVPEDATNGDIKRLFPCVHSRVKPISKDECWEQIQALALRTIEDLKTGKAVTC